ncbi:MAG: hypothetical protein QXP36_08690 [Conexivisphaerales archaeon]|uniref:hypothetical protein n=1 Tax=Metallosphaera sp. TaxID=2020860 RepID=UPI003175D29E
MSDEYRQDYFALGKRVIKAGDVIVIYVTKNPITVKFETYEPRLQRICVTPLTTDAIDYMCVKLKDIKYIATVTDHKNAEADK